MKVTFLPSCFDYVNVGNVMYFDFDGRTIAETHIAPGDTHLVTAVWQDAQWVWTQAEKYKGYGEGKLSRSDTPEAFARLMRRVSQAMQVPVLDWDTPPAWVIVSAAQIAVNCGGPDSQETRLRLLMIRSIRRVGRRVSHVLSQDNSPKWINQAGQLYECLKIAHESELNLRRYGQYATNESLAQREKTEAEWDAQRDDHGRSYASAVEGN